MNVRSMLKGILPVVTLVIAGLSYKYLVETRAEPAREEPGDSRVLVEVIEAREASEGVVLRAHGTVRAAQQITLQAEVGGRVVWHSKKLVPGGVFRRGERILRLEGRDYRLALDSRHAEVSRAELELELERNRRVVAEREWESIEHRGDQGEGRALALREPHLRTAEVGVSAARSSLEKAQVDLSRTTLTAPFNCTVEDENVDLGQVVTPGTQIARLVGTDEYWVQVAIPVDALRHVRLPRGDDSGASATVRQRIGDDEIVRQGKVLRLLPNVDAQGAMARLLVSIADPLGIEDGEAKALPLLLGSFVDVEIETDRLEGVVEVPRGSVHEGNLVYVMSDEGKLEIREVRVAWARPETVLVDRGLRGGDRIVTSFIPTPVPGMGLRVEDEASPPNPEAAPTAAVTQTTSVEAAP